MTDPRLIECATALEELLYVDDNTGQWCILDDTESVELARIVILKWLAQSATQDMLDAMFSETSSYDGDCYLAMNRQAAKAIAE